MKSNQVPFDFGAFASLDSMEGLTQLDIALPSGKKALSFGLLSALYPGLLSALLIAVAAFWLSRLYTAPVMLVALPLGMAFGFLQKEGRCMAGIEFASRQVLQFGVALLGARITFEQVAGLGILPVLTVLAGVATTILLGIFSARWLGLTRVLGLLSGAAVAICGSSAVLAIAAVLPEKQDGERDVIVSVVVITALSTLAMMVYPLLSTAIGLDPVRAGIFLGGTIHNVPQAVGAGYMISRQTGDIATYVKLLRVATLAPVVVIVTLLTHRRGGMRQRATPLLPGFVVGFIVLVAINSAGLLPPYVVSTAGSTAEWCLVISIAALGTKTSLGNLVKVGCLPVVLMVVETAWLAILVLLAVRYLI